MGKHLEQALPSVYTFQCLTGKVDNNNNNNNNNMMNNIRKGESFHPMKI